MPLAGVITNPDWLTKPDGDEMGRVYPLIATTIGLEGRTTLKCQVNASGRLEACTVLSEQPSGIGFGQAAILMSGSFRMKPKTVDGAPVGGGEITIPIHFTLAPSDPIPSDLDGAPRPSDNILALSRRLAVASGANEYLDQALAAELNQLRITAYAPSSGAGASTQDQALGAIADSFNAQRGAYLDQIALAYSRQFTEAELTQLVAHFENPAQKLWLSKQATLQKLSGPITLRMFTKVADGARQRFCQKVSCVAITAAAPKSGG